MKTQVGSCPHCGAPIYQPTAWWGITPPPNEFTCFCLGNRSGVQTLTTGTNLETPTMSHQPSKSNESTKEMLSEWRQQCHKNDLTQNIVALLGIHGVHCVFEKYQDGSHITKAFEELFSQAKDAERENAMEELYEKALEAIEKAFWDGVEQGAEDYAGEFFDPKYYLTPLEVTSKSSDEDSVSK